MKGRKTHSGRGKDAEKRCFDGGEGERRGGIDDAPTYDLLAEGEIFEPRINRFVRV